MRKCAYTPVSFHSAPVLHDAVLLAIIFAVVVLISVCTAGVGGPE